MKTKKTYIIFTPICLGRKYFMEKCDKKDLNILDLVSDISFTLIKRKRTKEEL